LRKNVKKRERDREEEMMMMSRIDQTEIFHQSPEEKELKTIKKVFTHFALKNYEVFDLIFFLSFNFN
jgi:hypothetical protein